MTEDEQDSKAINEREGGETETFDEFKEALENDGDE